MSDLAERLADLTSRNDAAEEPVYSDEEAKDAFLHFLSEGFQPPFAAKKAQRTATWFRRRRNPDGVHFDEEFTAAYESIMSPDGDHRAALIESAREALIEEAKRGNVRAIEKILMAYDPDFQFMRPAQFQGDWNIDKLQVFFGELPLEALQQMKAQLQERRRMKELPVIDAE